MDSNFLEFWGNLLIGAAKGQKQLDNLTQWIPKGFQSFMKVDDLAALFKKVYGLDRVAEESPDYMKTWTKSSEEFQKSFNDYMNMMGMAPKSEHLALIKKYEELKEKAASQEETIKHLRMLLSEKGIDQGEVVKTFNELLQKQGEQFQELLNQFSKFYSAPSDIKNSPSESLEPAKEK